VCRSLERFLRYFFVISPTLLFLVVRVFLRYDLGDRQDILEIATILSKYRDGGKSETFVYFGRGQTLKTAGGATERTFFSLLLL